jgi:hypothetical protein
MSKSQIYPLTKRPQLIDLNGEHVNFRLEFQVKAVKPENEFQAIVLTQDQLDSVDLNKIEMKQAKGKINGNITANNNKYQNYFLVLKKKEEFPDHEVEVNIHLDQIPGQAVMEADNYTTRPIEEQQQQDLQQQQQQGNEEASILPFYRRPWFGVAVLIVLLGIGYFLYNFVYLKKPFLWFNAVKTIASSSSQSASGAAAATTAAVVTTPVTTAPSPALALAPAATTAPTSMQAVLESGAGGVTMESLPLLSQAPAIQINHPVENQIYTKLSQIASL